MQKAAAAAAAAPLDVAARFNLISSPTIFMRYLWDEKLARCASAPTAILNNHPRCGRIIYRRREILRKKRLKINSIIRLAGEPGRHRLISALAI